MHPVLRLSIRNFVSTLDRPTLFFNLVFPLFFIFIQGFAFTGIIPDFELGGTMVTYPVFLAAGAVTFTVINSGMTAGQLLWFDRKHGMFEQILIGPFTRPQYIASMIISTIFISLISAGLALAFAMPVLLSATLTPTGFLFAGIDLVLGSLFFGSLAIVLSVKLRSSESFQILSTFIFFVFLFTSSVFYPVEKVPLAIQIVSLVNPLTYVADIFRAGLLGIVTSLFIFKLVALVVESIVMFILAIIMFRRIKA